LGEDGRHFGAGSYTIVLFFVENEAWSAFGACFRCEFAFDAVLVTRKANVVSGFKVDVVAERAFG
jgi:hypothetical protein